MRMYISKFEHYGPVVTITGPTPALSETNEVYSVRTTYTFYERSILNSGRVQTLQIEIMDYSREALEDMGYSWGSYNLEGIN